MVSTEFKGVGLHYTAFRDAIREDSRQTTPSRGVTPRKKFAVEANVESRANINIRIRIIEAKIIRRSSKLSDKSILRYPHTDIMNIISVISIP